jgi:hypothetical protein
MAYGTSNEPYKAEESFIQRYNRTKYPHIPARRASRDIRLVDGEICHRQPPKEDDSHGERIGRLETLESSQIHCLVARCLSLSLYLYKRVVITRSGVPGRQRAAAETSLGKAC